MEHYPAKASLYAGGNHGEKPSIATLLVATAVGSGVAWAAFTNPRTPVEYFLGHSHGEPGQTTGAPQHSGGTDAYGCHNASVPYHCH